METILLLLPKKYLQAIKNKRAVTSDILKASVRVKFICIILFLFSMEKYEAQDLQNNRNQSYYTYIYSISNKDAQSIYDENAWEGIVSENMLTQVVDSFLTNCNYKKKLPIGHYIYVHAINENLHYELKSINSIDAYIYVEKNNIMFFPYIKNSLKPIDNAIVELNKHRAIYDKKTNAYKLRKTKEGFITVTLGSEQAYYSIEKRERYWEEKKSILKRLFSKKSSRNHYRHYYDDLNNGYITFNKPKYLPKDTVKFKAMVLTKKGKYFNGDIEVRFGTDYQNNKKLTTLKPISPGAYVYQFVLGDSLTLNETYNIEIADVKTGKRLIETNGFQLEDYQLNETTYHINADKEKYSKGEPVTFYVWGKDANGFNLLDTRVEIKAKVSSVSKYKAETLFVPNVLWQSTQNLDPLGETKIVMPDSVFPAADLTFDIIATFNNSNNETHDTTFTLDYSCLNKKLLVKLDSEYIKADYLLNTKSTFFKGKLVKETHENRTEEEITYPYKEKINPNVTQYEFLADSLFETVYDDRNRSSLYLAGYRTVDSVFIITVNPHGLEITYSIFKGNKEIEKGISKNIYKNLRDESNDVYYVNYHYTWIGEAEEGNITIQLYDKALDVDVQQPNTIYPGQKTKIKIKITDVQKKPVENVNITAYAVNSLFGRTNNTHLSYFGKRYGKNINHDDYKLEGLNNETGNLFLSDKWRSKMGLDTMPYYKMLYPKNGIHYNYDSVQTINAQFAPFFFDNGKRVPIYLIYIDGSLVYYYDTDNADEYAFVTSYGYHNIRIRTADKEYQVDSVLLKQGLKLDLAIDVNHLPKNTTVFLKSDQLTQEEKVNLKNSVISIYDYPGGENYLWQDNKAVVFCKDKQYYGSSSLKRFGGFFPKNINFAVQNDFNQTFLFEPGYDYRIKDGVVKMTSNSLFTSNISLPAISKTPKMGLKATSLRAIKLRTPNNDWYKGFIQSYVNQTEEGNGTFEYEYVGDSTICLIRIQKECDDPLFRFYRKGYKTTFYDLQPGFYNVTYITPNKYFIKIDSIKILPNGTLFHRIRDKPFGKYIPKDIKDTIKKVSVRTNWTPPQELSLFNSYSYDNLKGSGAIHITLTDKKNKETIPFANIVLYRNSMQVAVGTTDMDGNVLIKPLPAGRYNVKAVYVGYQPQQINDVIVTDNKVSYLNIRLSNDRAILLEEVQVVEYSIPLIDPDTKSGGTITRESFSYMAAKNINSVVSTQAGVIMVRGSRSDSSGVFVDGERLITGGLPAEYGDVKQVRNKFSDYAYWQPNLITDKNGEAFFDVTFPDNVTNWKSYAIALDDKKHSGRGFVETKAYKNIMANLALPRFMLQGDSAMVVGKTLNYTDKAIKAKTCFKLNDKVIIQHDTSIKNSVIEKVFITSVNEDSIKVNYSVEQYNGPKDGEERSIPVMSLGIEETKGLFFVLNRDTTLTIDLDSGTTEIYIQNNPIDFMLKEIEQLKNYPYWCMEQTASKLNALLMEEKIKNQLHQDFEGKKSIKKLLRKLEKGQKQNGSWGWWEDSPDNAWMTSYITRIINEAKKMGYEYKNIEKARQYLLWNLSGLQGNELLSVLNTFSEMNVAVPYADYLKRFEKDSLSLYQKFLITKIKQENRLSYDLKLIMKTKKETILKGVYWGNDGYGWYDNSTNISLLAYKILEKSDSNNAYLPHIRNYFLEIKNQNKWRNTIETANILETILPAFLRQSDNKIQPTSITLTGAMNENVLVFPFKKTVTETDKKLTVTKTGSSPAFFTSYQKQWNSHPKKKEDYYAIKTYYEVKGKKTDALTAGVPTNLVIEVDASKKAEYVMIEVPIPAGCSYDDNKFNTTYYEVHREYFKNKTSIFCQELTQGKHIFKIKLQPRFTGSYHLNPAKAELMYFPIFYGRNEMKKTCIR